MNCIYIGRGHLGIHYGMTGTAAKDWADIYWFRPDGQVDEYPVGTELDHRNLYIPPFGKEAI